MAYGNGMQCVGSAQRSLHLPAHTPPTSLLASALFVPQEAEGALARCADAVRRSQGEQQGDREAAAGGGSGAEVAREVFGVVVEAARKKGEGLRGPSLRYYWSITSNDAIRYSRSAHVGVCVRAVRLCSGLLLRLGTCLQNAEAHVQRVRIPCPVPSGHGIAPPRTLSPDGSLTLGS